MCCGFWGAQHPASADWQANARVNTEVQFDDNPLLLPSGEASVFGITVSPDIGLSWGSSFSRLDLHGGVDYDKFSGNGRASGGKSDDLDSFGQNVGANFRTQDDRNILNLNGSYTNQTTRTSEIEETGVIVTNAYRRTYVGALSYSWRATELDSFDISANGSNVSFTTDLLTGYDNYGGDLGYRRKISELDDVGLSVGYSRTNYDSSVLGVAEVSTAKLTWDRKGGQGLDLSLAIGGQQLQSTETTEYGMFFMLKANVELTGRDELEITASNAFDPNATGNTVKKRQFTATYTHRYTQDVTGQIRALVLSQESNGNQTGDRLYYEIGPKIGWQFLPNWNVSARYRYRAQKADPGDQHASSNAVFVALTYRLPSLPLF